MTLGSECSERFRLSWTVTGILFPKKPVIPAVDIVVFVVVVVVVVVIAVAVIGGVSR